MFRDSFLSSGLTDGRGVDIWVIALGGVRLRRLASALSWPQALLLQALHQELQTDASTPGAGQGLLRWGGFLSLLQCLMPSPKQ